VALALFATPDDVQAVMGEPMTEGERQAAQGLIDQASVELRLRVPGIDAFVPDDELRTAKARAAVVGAVRRALSNPTGARQLTEVVGPFTTSATYPADAGPFTADELFGLTPTTTGIPGTAFVRPGYTRGRR